MGQNVITVTAASTLGSTASATLTVTRTGPAVIITQPTSAAVYSTQQRTLNLSGTASGFTADASVAWSSDSGASGTCVGTDSWTAGGVPLVSGQNVLTVTAADDSGDKASTTLTVTYTPDTTKPVIEISTPTDEGSCSRNCPVLTIGGTATDNVSVAGVAYSNATTGQTGTCVLTGTTWSAGGINLAAGANEITATATDGAGNTASAVVNVNYVEALPGTAWTGLAMVSLPIVPDETDPEVEVGFSDNMWCAFITDANQSRRLPRSTCVAQSG